MSIRNNLIAIKSLMLYYMYMSFQKQENNKADEYHMTTSQKKRQYIFLPQGKWYRYKRTRNIWTTRPAWLSGYHGIMCNTETICLTIPSLIIICICFKSFVLNLLTAQQTGHGLRDNLIKIDILTCVWCTCSNKKEQ